MTNPSYVTREQVMAAADLKPSALLTSAVDRLIFTASRHIDSMFHRTFFPRIETKGWDWPSRGSVWTPDDLLSASAVTLDGYTVTGFRLEPRAYGAPYAWIDFDDATSSSGDEVSVTGVWGYSDDTAPAGALAAAVSSTTATSITVTNGALVGVGDQLLVGTERMVVTNKVSSDTTADTSGDLAANNATVTVPVTNGALVNAGETILVDSERMLVLDVVGNNLTVKRAHEGTVLATHSSGASVYAYRLLTVERGNAGTTAATHLISAAIERNFPPPEITELALAEVQSLLGQEAAAWNLTIGTGENARESSGKSLYSLRKQVRAEYGRARWSRAA